MQCTIASTIYHVHREEVGCAIEFWVSDGERENGKKERCAGEGIKDPHILCYRFVLTNITTTPPKKHSVAYK